LQDFRRFAAVDNPVDDVEKSRHNGQLDLSVSSDFGLEMAVESTRIAP
jgi:hypothetical protein